jgi:mono/diheme cytochrome c family protein
MNSMWAGDMEPSNPDPAIVGSLFRGLHSESASISVEVDGGPVAHLLSLSVAAVALGSGLAVMSACARASPSATEGRSLYLSNGCASCHGLSGRGDGPVARSLGVRPTDLRNPALFSRGSEEGAIARTLAEGILDAGANTSELHHTHHELSMPSYAHLTDAERHSIALYVRSLQTKAVRP